MSTEYIFASTLDEASVFAKAQGWRKAGRSGFIKPDGTVIHFIYFEQLLDSRPCCGAPCPRIQEVNIRHALKKNPKPTEDPNHHAVKRYGQEAGQC